MFAEVAQQVLEYLGVPHDIDVQPAKPGDKKPLKVNEDDGGQSEGDIRALYAAVNDLPSDDPLRGESGSQATTGAQLAVGGDERREERTFETGDGCGETGGPAMLGRRNTRQRRQADRRLEGRMRARVP